MATIAITAAFLLLTILVSILILWLLARLFRAPNSKWRHAVIAFVLSIPLAVLILFAERFLIRDESSNNQNVALFWVIVLACQLLQFLIYKVNFKLSLPKSVGYFFSHLICEAAVALGAAAFFVTTLVHPYVCSKLACAPTLIGVHRIDKCPNCGGKLYVREIDASWPVAMTNTHANDGICENCHKFSVAKNPSAQHFGADSVMSAHFLTPKRWDLVTYAPPDRSAEEQVIFVGRVVGLPGETVVIKDGSVFINGQRQSPPPEIAAVEYDSDLVEGFPAATFVDREAPKLLGQDEFCVLGDFSENSLDSRYFGPVPRKKLNGVVTVCYWPPSRWRIWR